MIFNVVAIVVSVAALATSTYIALQHQTLQKAANFTPSYMQLIRQLQTMEFHDHYEYVTRRLAIEHDPELGISGLPDDARRAVYDITYFFYGFAMLHLFDALDDQVFPTMAHRVAAVWEAIAPYVERERELGLSGLYLRVLEEFAKEAKSLPPESVSAMLARRRIAKNRRSLRVTVWHRR